MKKSGYILALIIGLVGCQRGLDDDVVAIGSNVILHFAMEVDGRIVDTSRGGADFGENYHGFRSKITTHSERSDAGCLIIVKW